MTLHVKDGGTWREVNECHVKDGGNWKEAVVVYTKDSGAWRTALDNLIVGWGNITNPENEISWSGATTLNTAGQYSLTWPGSTNAFKAVIKGAGGGNSNGGQGAAGGSTTLYLAKGTFDLLAVVGDAGQYGNPAGPYNRNCGNTIGNCADNNNEQIDARGFGGRPGRGFSPHNWGSSGGGFSGIFIDDNNTTSPQGYRYFYCTPVAIAGGGGGGQAYNINANAGGGHSLGQSTHYFTRATAYTALDVEDINFTYAIDIDSNTGCYSGCRLTHTGSENINLYLRPFDGTGGAGFASAGGPGAQGGAGFVYGLNGVHLSALGYSRNPGTLAELDAGNGLVHPNSSTTSGNGSAVQVAGQITYYWGTVPS